MAANTNVNAVVRLPGSHVPQSLISDDTSIRMTESEPTPTLVIKLFAPHHDDPAHSLPDQWRHAIAEHLPQLSAPTSSSPSAFSGNELGVRLQIVTGYLEEDGVTQVLRSSGTGFDEVRADCVVSPANSYGIMGGG